MTAPRNPALRFAQLIAAVYDDLDLLDTSATFAMSRGAKELFHTNFLAYVLEAEVPDGSADADILEETQRKLLKLLFGHEKVRHVLAWREYRSLDLVLLAAPRVVGEELWLDETTRITSPAKGTLPVCEDVCLVVLEAKLKSLPTEEQFCRYDETIWNGLGLEFEDPSPEPSEAALARARGPWELVSVKRQKSKSKNGYVNSDPGVVLLSAKDTQDDEDGVATTGKRSIIGLIQARMARKVLAWNQPMGGSWELVAWSALLECFPAENGREGGLLVELLKDYRRSTSALVRVGARTLAAAAAFASDSGHTLGEMHGVLMDPAFRKRRIHDLVGKLAFSSLARGVVDELKADLRGFEVSGVKFEIEWYAFMTRATPGFTVAWRASGPSPGRSKKPRVFATGVQVQRCEYRHFTSASHAEKRTDGLLKQWSNKLERSDTAQSKWWRTAVSAGGVAIPLGAGAGEGTDAFRPFGEEHFLYTFAAIPSCTFDELVEALKRSLNTARELVMANNALVGEIRAFLEPDFRGAGAAEHLHL
jgi:hypothetical protein